MYSSVNFGKLCPSRNWFTSFSLSNCGHKVIWSILFLILSMYMRSTINIPSFISDINNFCPLSFCFSLAGKTDFTGLFRMVTFVFYWFFSTEFLFSISLISALILMIYFLMLTLDLICSSKFPEVEIKVIFFFNF